MSNTSVPSSTTQLPSSTTQLPSSSSTTSAGSTDRRPPRKLEPIPKSDQMVPPRGPTGGSSKPPVQKPISRADIEPIIIKVIDERYPQLNTKPHIQEEMSRNPNDCESQLTTHNHWWPWIATHELESLKSKLEELLDESVHAAFWKRIFFPEYDEKSRQPIRYFVKTLMLALAALICVVMQLGLLYTLCLSLLEGGSLNSLLYDVIRLGTPASDAGMVLGDEFQSTDSIGASDLGKDDLSSLVLGRVIGLTAVMWAVSPDSINSARMFLLSPLAITAGKCKGYTVPFRLLFGMFIVPISQAGVACIIVFMSCLYLKTLDNIPELITGTLSLVFIAELDDIVMKVIKLGTHRVMESLVCGRWGRRNQVADDPKQHQSRQAGPKDVVVETADKITYVCLWASANLVYYAFIVIPFFIYWYCLLSPYGIANEDAVFTGFYPAAITLSGCSTVVMLYAFY